MVSSELESVISGIVVVAEAQARIMLLHVDRGEDLTGHDCLDGQKCRGNEDSGASMLETPGHDGSSLDGSSNASSLLPAAN